MTTTDATRMEDDDHATHAALRSSKTGVRDSLGSTIVPPPPSDSASDRSSYDDDLDEDLSAVDGDEERTMEDEDPDPAFETIERGPLADFDDDELRGILARADLDAEDDDEDFLDDDDVNDEVNDEEDLGEGSARREPMSTSAALAALKSTRPRTARAPSAAADVSLDAATKKKKPPNNPGKIVGPNLAAKAWFADLATLRNRQRLVEHRELAPALDKLDPDLESTARRDAEASRRECAALSGDLAGRLKRVREAVNELGVHVVNIRGGDEYVRTLGRLMDGAEKDIVALKEAQRCAFDALQKEEKELRDTWTISRRDWTIPPGARAPRARSSRASTPATPRPSARSTAPSDRSAPGRCSAAPRGMSRGPWRRRRVFQPTRRRRRALPIPVTNPRTPRPPRPPSEARDREGGPGRPVGARRRHHVRATHPGPRR